MFGSSDKSSKNVVDYLAIKVDVTNKDRPYYTIIYHLINSENTYEGYGKGVQKRLPFVMFH